MKKQTLSWDGDTLRIAYNNGSIFWANCQQLPESIYQSCAAARHGIAQKLGDAKSGGSAAEKLTEVELIWDSLLNGDWNRKADVSAFIEAAFEILAASAGMPEKATVWLDAYHGLTAEGKEEARKKPAIAAAITQAKAQSRLSNLEDDAEDAFNPFA